MAVVQLPESSKDITLYQYQRLVELLGRTDLDQRQTDSRKLHLFTGIKLSEIELISITDREEMLNQIDIALNQAYQFEQKFNIDGVEFGFIPNLDKITSGEYFDLSKYGESNDTLHNLMAILFRPIKDRDSLGNYSIVDYTGTEAMAEIMKLTPMNVVNGALFFFANLQNELLTYIQRYTEVERARAERQATTSVSGDGTQPLTS